MESSKEELTNRIDFAYDRMDKEPMFSKEWQNWLSFKTDLLREYHERFFNPTPSV